jgi:hypothetical protein
VHPAHLQSDRRDRRQNSHRRELTVVSPPLRAGLTSGASTVLVSQTAEQFEGRARSVACRSLFGGEFVGGDGVVARAGAQDHGREFGLVRGIGKVLGFQAERSVLWIANAALADGGWDGLLNGVAHPLEFGFSKGAAFEFVFCVHHACLARATERPLGHVNQGAQGGIDGLLVREILSDVR